MYNRMPLEFIGITGSFNPPSHYGVDFGWNSEYGGKTAPIYSINDGVVIDKGYNNSSGNYVWIKTIINNNTFLHRYLHMERETPLNIGDNVKRGEIIGNMGNTGDSTGNHLHFELWKCPINYKFNWNDRSKYAVNPLEYVFLFFNQVTNDNKITRVLGTDLIKTRDTNKDQVLVKEEYLRCRKNPNGEILGYIDYGLYDILDTKDEAGYTWIQVDINKWFAYTGNVIIYKKETPDEPCKEYTSFTAPKDGIYYIDLLKGESVYYKKR